MRRGRSRTVGAATSNLAAGGAARTARDIACSSSGTPSPLSAEIVGHGRGRKIRVFKYKNKTRSRKTRGHRQDETTLRITKIEG